VEKLVVIMRHMQDENVVHEYTATHDLNAPPGNSKNLLTRLRTLVRRELINRGLIPPEEEDTKRVR
jgi:hypothetical protein